MEIIPCSNPNEARKQTEKALRELLVAAKKITQPVLLLLSGGSAFGVLQGIDRSVLGKYVTFSVLDERYSGDENVNNFAQLMRTVFFAESIASGSCCIDTRVQENESLQDLAFRFEAAIRDWRQKNKDGVVYSTMGVGTDGHTAGILPFPEDSARFMALFEDENHWVVGYSAGNKNPYPERVTVTLPFLRREVDAAVAYAVGREKREAVSQVLMEKGSIFETPARVMREMKKVTLFSVGV